MGFHVLRVKGGCFCLIAAPVVVFETLAHDDSGEEIIEEDQM